MCNILYKRKHNSSIIHFTKERIKLSVKETYKNKNIINEFIKIFKIIFCGKMFIFKKTLVGSDFHYSSDILKLFKKKKINRLYKNLFILDSSLSKNQLYFPTFRMIYDSSQFHGRI